jgi:hypothetical protein
VAHEAKLTWLLITKLEDPGVDGGDNIEMDLREVGWGDMNWINLAQDRDRWRVLVNTVMNLRVS